MKYLFFAFVFLYGAATWASDETRLSCVSKLGSKKYIFDLVTSSTIQGYWTKTKTLAKEKKVFIHKSAVNSRDIFFLESPRHELIKLCYREMLNKLGQDRFYFASLEAIKAFRAKDKRCNGHPVLYLNKDSYVYPVLYKTPALLKKKLADFNFAVVLEGLIYRSKHLGDKGIERLFRSLKEEDQPLPRSIASIHVMGFGGEFGSHNLEEIEDAKKLGLTFLHSYSADPKLTVYLDGTDPSKVADNDPHHGNIYRRETVNKFIPDAKVRAQLKVEESIAANRMVVGDTADFLQSIENMIDAPWPLLIHCKGGRHKTGMLAIIFEYLAFKSSMKAEFSTNVSIPMYKTRFDLWWSKKSSFFNIFFGGPLYEQLSLRPAEMHYVEHNKDVFRQQNITFIRGIISGELLKTETMREHWLRIQHKLQDKLKSLETTTLHFES